MYVPFAQADTSPDAFVDWARPQAISLARFPSDANSAQRVADIVGSARMVSLGEPAHGTHEPLAFRNRLFQFLVEQRGFTAIALESGFNEARRVNDFVLGEAGDPQDIARTGLTWGFGGYAENVELLRWIRQYNSHPARQRTLFRLSPANISGEGVVAEFHQAAAARDAAMADNALWALRREGASGRVFLFAHNAHILRGSLRGGVWNVYPQAPTMMGQHLHSALGRDLVTIGTSSASNRLDLSAAASEAGTVDVALASVGMPHFLLDLRAAPDPAITWLQQMQSLRVNFATQIEISPQDAFDAFVYFEQL